MILQPFRLNWFTIPWNIVMCIYSGWTFLAFFDIFWTVWKSRDFDLFVPICDPTQEIVKGKEYSETECLRFVSCDFLV